ncbi:MAG: TatD family hydrolase [bacterium]
MWIDTHCHLDAAEFDGDRHQVLERLTTAGIDKLVIPAVERANFAAVRDLAHSDARLVYALGIHPMYVYRAQDSDLLELRQALKLAWDDPQFIGIGEIGLDFFDPTALCVTQRQEFFYVEQLKLAAELNLPVILHVRRSQDALLKQLRRVGTQGGIAHAFNGSRQQAEAFIRLGFKLGFGGAMTFDRALQIRRLAHELPLEALVLETDAPDIPPAWLRPGRNEPAQLPRIAEALAQIRGLSLPELAAVTTRNALQALPRLGAAQARPD